MSTDRPGTALESIRSMLDHGERICLFLDFDGTLLELAETPDAIRVDPALPALLARAHAALGGALAVVSGRRIDALDALLAPLRLPAAGVHGHERRDANGTIHRMPARRETLEPLRRRCAEFVARDPRLLLEDKGEALALHYRRAPELGAEVLAFAARTVDELPEGFALQPGDRVVEVKSSLFSKGSAVQDFLREPPFAQRQPVAIGDDFTDVDAFRVVEYLGGLSIAVGHRIEGRARLPGPLQVRRFLEELSELALRTAPSDVVRAHA
ncbi:MAG: trehalose-phosphatase [Gammaproteobacteria bacterium]|nr:trehalose-phosphatase [Gammaproteobacteria bacterium]